MTLHRIHEDVNPFHIWAKKNDAPRNARRLAYLVLAAMTHEQMESFLEGSTTNLDSSWETLKIEIRARNANKWLDLRACAAAFVEDKLSDIAYEARNGIRF